MDYLIIVDYLRLSAAMLSLCSYGLPDHRGLSYVVFRYVVPVFIWTA